MSNALTNVKVDFVSLVDRAAVRDPQAPTEPRRFLVWKREHPTDQGEGPMPETVERADLEKAEHERDELRKQLEDQTELKTQLTKAQADLAAAIAKGEQPDEKPAEIDKSELPPAVREALEKAEQAETLAKAERDELRKQADEATKIAKAERETRLTREFVVKAEGFRALPVEPAKFGPVLKSASEKLSAEESAELDRVLKAADEQIAAGELFKEHGRSGEAKREGTALAEATEKAQEIKKSDSSLTDTQALDRVLSSDRALQERYLAEQRGL